MNTEYEKAAQARKGRKGRIAYAAFSTQPLGVDI